jgi:hypothetical protein
MDLNASTIIDCTPGFATRVQSGKSGSRFLQREARLNYRADNGVLPGLHPRECKGRS